MHDYSRDIMLATSQEDIETKMALSAAESKAAALTSQLKRLDDVQQKTDELLYQMIPKTVASRLRWVDGKAIKKWVRLKKYLVEYSMLPTILSHQGFWDIPQANFSDFLLEFMQDVLSSTPSSS